MHANLPLALLSPLVPSVLSRVGAEMGPTFWKLQKCAAFRQPHRYQLHVALAVAFSFFEQNGAAAEKWKMGASGGRRRYRRHFAQPLGMRVAGSDACAQRPRFFKRADATVESQGVVHLLASPLTVTPVPTHRGS